VRSVSTGLKKVPSEFEEASISKRELKGLKPTEIVIVPTKNEGEDRREDDLERKRIKSEKYLETTTPSSKTT